MEHLANGNTSRTEAVPLHLQPCLGPALWFRSPRQYVRYRVRDEDDDDDDDGDDSRSTAVVCAILCVDEK